MPYDDSKSSDYSLKVGIGQYAQLPKDTDKKRDWEKLRDYAIAAAVAAVAVSVVPLAR